MALTKNQALEIKTFALTALRTVSDSNLKVGAVAIMMPRARMRSGFTARKSTARTQKVCSEENRQIRTSVNAEEQSGRAFLIWN